MRTEIPKASLKLLLQFVPIGWLSTVTIYSKYKCYFKKIMFLSCQVNWLMKDEQFLLIHIECECLTPSRKRNSILLMHIYQVVLMCSGQNCTIDKCCLIVSHCSKYWHIPSGRVVILSSNQNDLSSDRLFRQKEYDTKRNCGSA